MPSNGLMCPARRITSFLISSSERSCAPVGTAASDSVAATLPARSPCVVMCASFPMLLLVVMIEQRRRGGNCCCPELRRHELTQLRAPIMGFALLPLGPGSRSASLHSPGTRDLMSHATAGELPSHPIGREAERSELKRAFCSSLSES